MSRIRRHADLILGVVPTVERFLTSIDRKHALIGGVAVGVLVEFRATKDIDYVIDAVVADAPDILIRARAAGFTVRDEESERLLRSHMTRLWTLDSAGVPLMIDLLLNEHPFYQSVIDRARVDDLNGFKASTATAEDILLLKILASRPQDVVDAHSLVETYGRKLDREYLSTWADELGVREPLDALMAQHGH